MPIGNGMEWNGMELNGRGLMKACLNYLVQCYDANSRTSNEPQIPVFMVRCGRLCSLWVSVKGVLCAVYCLHPVVLCF
jgi:hypothetical protein